MSNQTPRSGDVTVFVDRPDDPALVAAGDEPATKLVESDAAGTQGPRALVLELERSASVPDWPGEAYAGYGVMGLPFTSGHLLAMRRFPASSVGCGYRSVWHRDPQGRWTLFQDISREQGCARYFGAAVAAVLDAEIGLEWTGPSALAISVRGGGHSLDWQIELASSITTRLMSATGSLLPESFWRSPAVMASMSRVGGPMLHAGKVRLTGRAPNGQRFIANPIRVWLIAASTATLDGVQLGEPGPAPAQGELGDFRIPQRGVFAIGRTLFCPGPVQPKAAGDA